LLTSLLLVAACDHRTPVPPPETSAAERESTAAGAPQGEPSAEQGRYPDLARDESADQRPANTRELGAAGLSPVDKLFLASAAAAGLAEVEASRLALERATDPKVKDFARHMIKEHERLNEQLRRIAADKGIGIAPEVHGDPRDELEALRRLSGKDFDAAYVKNFGFDAHKKATVLYERQIREGRDADLKAYAEKALPELRDHHAMAEYLIMTASR